MSVTVQNSKAAEKAAEKAAKAQAVRNFRTGADIDNFYRFVYDSKLRREARLVFETIFARVKQYRKRNRRPKGTKIQ